MKSRRDCVLEALRANRSSFIPGYRLTTPDIGGSEGLRRLRELRAAGYVIAERKVAGSAAWEYRLIAEPGELRQVEMAI